MSLSDLHLTSTAGLVGIGAIIATTWGYIKSFLHYFVGIFIGTSILKDDAGAAAQAFSLSCSIKSPLGMRVFGGYESYVHPKRWTESVGYEGITSDPVLIKYKKSFALLSLSGGFGNNGMESMIGSIGEYGKIVKIRYLRWFFDIESFTIDAIEYYNSQKRSPKINENNKSISPARFRILRYSGNGGRLAEGNDLGGGKQSGQGNYPVSAKESNRTEEMIMNGVYRLLKWNRKDLQMKPEEGQSPFTGYPFPEEVQVAIKELKCWLSHEKWFRSKSIPWRRGWLLYGRPGTGKSTLTRALGMSFDLPVFIFDLAGMSNNELVKSWDEMLANTPCITLIEDIDAIFDGRTYIGSKSNNIPHITFDCLLNCISGVKQSDGVFLIITTNHIEKLDPALGIPDASGKSTRPGRIDRAIELGLMQEEQRIVLASHILSDFPELINETVKNGEGETAAQFQARCAKIALDKFWKDDRFLELKSGYKEIVHIDNVPQDTAISAMDDYCKKKKEHIAMAQYLEANRR